MPAWISTAESKQESGDDPAARVANSKGCIASYASPEHRAVRRICCNADTRTVSRLCLGNHQLTQRFSRDGEFYEFADDERGVHFA